MTRSIAATLAGVARHLDRAGIDSARREARLIVGHALGLGVAGIIADPERRLTEAEEERLSVLVARRARREPLSHITGYREFWSLPFRVTADTLDPRPDSETTVQAALDCVPDRAARLRLLDLGTGTGCLLLALLSELPRASGLGIDCSAATLEVARANADGLGLTGRASFRLGDWGEGLDENFNLIVTNPPYIPDAEISRLAPEVALHEPRLALAGGLDGLESYRALARDLPRLLSANGHAVIEVGAGQADAVQGILHAAGLCPVRRAQDLGGIERCLVLGRE